MIGILRDSVMLVRQKMMPGMRVTEGVLVHDKSIQESHCVAASSDVSQQWVREAPSISRQHSHRDTTFTPKQDITYAQQ